MHWRDPLAELLTAQQAAIEGDAALDELVRYVAAREPWNASASAPQSR